MLDCKTKPVKYEIYDAFNKIVQDLNKKSHKSDIEVEKNQK